MYGFILLSVTPTDIHPHLTEYYIFISYGVYFFNVLFQPSKFEIIKKYEVLLYFEVFYNDNFIISYFQNFNNNKYYQVWYTINKIRQIYVCMCVLMMNHTPTVFYFICLFIILMI